MSRNFNKKLKALTILEVLVYLALFGTMFLLVVQFLITARESNQMAERRSDLEKTAIYLTNHLNSSFDLANSITDDANTVFDNDSGSIRLLLTGKYLQYSLIGTTLHFNNNGSDINITYPDMNITRFYLERLLSKGGTVVGVRITLVIVSPQDSRVTKTLVTSYLLK